MHRTLSVMRSRLRGSLKWEVACLDLLGGPPWYRRQGWELRQEPRAYQRLPHPIPIGTMLTIR